MMTIETDFLNCAAEKLAELCGRIETCLAKLTPEQIWMRGGENQNAVGNLVLHLNGNVRQWILSGVGGAPDTRTRDAEFAARGGTERAELVERLESTVREAIAVLGKVPPGRLEQRVTIQKYDLTVMEAIFHVVEHFSQHTGQILFATKMLTGEDLGFYKHLKAAAHAEKTP